MVKFKNDKRGLIQWLVIVLIAVLVLSYFGFDLRAIIESEGTQGNLGYLWGLGVTVWNEYLSRPILYFWHNIFIDLLWNSFIDNLERIKNGQPTTYEEMTPQLPS